MTLVKATLCSWLIFGLLGQGRSRNTTITTIATKHKKESSFYLHQVSGLKYLYTVYLIKKT